MLSQNTKMIYINKNKVSNCTNVEIIQYICKKLKIKEYCLIVNLRKLFPKYNNKLGNLIYITDNINTKENPRDIILRDHNKSVDELMKKIIPQSTIINSFLGFNKLKNIKHYDIIQNNHCGNMITIFPINFNNDYIAVEYRHK